MLIDERLLVVEIWLEVDTGLRVVDGVAETLLDVDGVNEQPLIEEDGVNGQPLVEEGVTTTPDEESLAVGRVLVVKYRLVLVVETTPVLVCEDTLVLIVENGLALVVETTVVLVDKDTLALVVENGLVMLLLLLLRTELLTVDVQMELAVAYALITGMVSAFGR